MSLSREATDTDSKFSAKRGLSVDRSVVAIVAVARDGAQGVAAGSLRVSDSYKFYLSSEVLSEGSRISGTRSEASWNYQRDPAGALEWR